MYKGTKPVTSTSPMNVDRRSFLSASTSLLAAPYICTAHAAGSLRIGFWDHFVPGANDTLIRLGNEWAEKEKVDLKIDFVPSLANKQVLTIAAQAQARSGHDILTFPIWYPAGYAAHLEPVDDVMQTLIAQYGAPASVLEYLGKQNGHWVAVPSTIGSQMKNPCARIDLFKQHVGLNVTQMYPATGAPDKALTDKWTWDTFLLAAEKCHRAGFPFGIGLGQTPDSVDSAGAIFAAFGAHLVDAKGDITVNSDAIRHALEYCRRLAQFLPPDVFAWDDASNNRWLISGKGALIMNPPSAWAVAKRDKPQVAEQLWTFPAPKGPKGRYGPCVPTFWGIWKFSKNKAAARSLLIFLSQRKAVEQLVIASGGYDIPPFPSMRNFSVWTQVGPPKGTLAHYVPRDDQIVSIAHAPAPVAIATQMYNQAILTKMIAKFTQSKEPLEKVISWAASELAGYLRT